MAAQLKPPVDNTGGSRKMHMQLKTAAYVVENTVYVPRWGRAPRTTPLGAPQGPRCAPAPAVNGMALPCYPGSGTGLLIRWMSNAVQHNSGVSNAVQQDSGATPVLPPVDWF